MNPRLTIVNYAKGGIGDQLFQHVFAASLARRLGAELRTDISDFGADPGSLSAAVWNLDPEAKKTTVAEQGGPGSYLLKEGQIHALEQLQQLPGDARTLVLDGYWQGESFFDPEVARHAYAQLCERVESQLDATLLARIRASPNAVAVHVRRRDYGHMGLCRNSYYVAAIEHLRANCPDAELYVFSDEPNFARHLLNSHGLAFTQVASGLELGDLYLMSLCRHFVISNSSYAWWGAWFGERCAAFRRAGLVIAPKEWVTIDSLPSPCPARWSLIEGAVMPFTVDSSEFLWFRQQLAKRATASPDM